jgi:hypothetical protein
MFTRSRQIRLAEYAAGMQIRIESKTLSGLLLRKNSE